MRIKLISVSAHKGNEELVPFYRRPKNISFPSLGLLILAALTDKEHELIIINDESEGIDYNDQVDLVGISFITPSSTRAYTIADRFRKKGVTVVFGGVHASALPEEAGMHCDSVVIGEAENIWPKLLEDFKNKRLQKVYRSNELINMDYIPFLRRDLLKKEHYLTTNIVQASRGCPFKCEFCSVGEMFGTKTRFRSVNKVIEEIKTLDDKLLVIADDDLASNIPYRKELFTQMIPIKRNWIGEASWRIAKDPELLDIMSKSGCKGLLIGFESLRHQDNINKISPQKDLKTLYSETINEIHKKGIIIFGTFIFGFDNDDYDVFGETLKFLLKSNIEYVTFGPLIPFPGTPLHKRLVKENRIIETDWREYKYYPPGICFIPLKLKNDHIRYNLKRMYKKFYSIRRIILFTFRMLKRYRNLRIVLQLLVISLSFRKRTSFGRFKRDIKKESMNNELGQKVIS